MRARPRSQSCLCVWSVGCGVGMVMGLRRWVGVIDSCGHTPYLEGAVGVEQHVVRLDVAVHDAGPAQVLEGAEELLVVLMVCVVR